MLSSAHRHQEALQARAGVLGALALEAVRQKEHHQAAQAVPLVLGAHDELVDDDLRAVDEVAELGLPDDQRFGRVEAVARTRSPPRRLAERAVDDLEGAWSLVSARGAM
jgi:hypothetical protein